MEKKYKVYCHTNKINNKKYIGVTGDNMQKRAGLNGSYYKGSTYFFHAIQKYGWDNFQHSVLFDNLTKEEASQKEHDLIEYYNTTNPDFGYNLREGGYEGYSFTVSDETKEKISKKLTGVKKSQEWHQHRKEYYENNPHPNEGHFGENSSGITKKVRCIQTGDVFGAIAEAVRWCNSSKVYQCCKGLRAHAGTHPTKKFQVSWEYAEDEAEVTVICNEPLQEKKTIKKVKCINTGQIFNNAKEAARYFDMEKNSCNINRCCKGKRKSAGKHPSTGEPLKWEFYEEKE